MITSTKCFEGCPFYPQSQYESCSYFNEASGICTSLRLQKERQDILKAYEESKKPCPNCETARNYEPGDFFTIKEPHLKSYPLHCGECGAELDYPPKKDQLYICENKDKCKSIVCPHETPHLKLQDCDEDGGQHCRWPWSRCIPYEPEKEPTEDEKLFGGSRGGGIKIHGPLLTQIVREIISNTEEIKED